MSSIVDNNSTSQFPVLELETNCANSAQEQEVYDLLQFLKLEYGKNLRYKFLINILQEYIEDNSNDNQELKEKVRSIILSHRVSQTLLLDTNIPVNGGMSLLGIGNIKEVELNYSERNVLQEIVESKLIEKNNFLHKKLNKADKEHLSVSTDTDYADYLQLSSEEKVLLSVRQKLVLEQEQYVKNLLDLQKLLLEISDLRLKKLQDGVELKIKHSQAQEKINSLKALFTEEKFKVDIFTETSCSLQAYKELIKDIKNQQKLFQNEIRELEDLKEKYKQVSCKQFDELLASYTQYKSSLEQKKKLYDYLIT